MTRPTTALLLAALALSPTMSFAMDAAPTPLAIEAVDVSDTDAADIAGRIGSAEDDGKTPAEREIEALQQQAELRQQRLAAELAELKEENERLQTQSALAQQRQQQELAKLLAEKQALETQMSLRSTQLEAESAPARAELELLQREQNLREAKLKAELSAMAIEVETLKQKQALEAARVEAELSAGVLTAQRLSAEQDLLDAQHRAKLAQMRRQLDEAELTNELATQQVYAAQRQLELEQQKISIVAGTAEAKLMTRKLEDQLKDRVEQPIEYRTQPFEDGVLYVSDRRIDLSGPIITGTADYLCDRIDYFNNQSPELPIFLVIDNCPGGSVMQGYRIVKAIETSKAPVHVVVKSFAASMAAIITTLADHSYAFPNAIILHHQMSAGASGNMTDLQEQIESLKEWERRFAEPVAAKMGIDVETFKERMYASSKSGDWEEFADKAVELKWVNQIVTELREESIRQKPSDSAPKPWWASLLMQDESGKSYVQLPPLEPYDAYFMINPNNFYRVQGR